MIGLTILSLAAAPAPQQSPNPFDVLTQAYAPYLAADDPLAFPMKIRSVSEDKIGLWRGGKDLFFLWCRDHAREWLDDREAYVTQEGDQHLGNVGTYLADGPFGTLAFGMVDFDDSQRLPFQYELLQGLISLRLRGEEAGLKLGDTALEHLAQEITRAYARAAGSNETATRLLGDEPIVTKLLGERQKRGYHAELDEYTERGRFIPVRATRKEVRDVLRPAPDHAAALAEGVAQAVARVPEAAKRFRLRTPEEFRAAMKDVVLRTRVGSAGSQGLKKYFVLLDRPLEGVDHDVILYVKQQIPSAPERVGLIPKDPRDPAQRCAEDGAEADNPDPYFNGWCEVGNESYWVTLREPWSDELDGAEVVTLHDLLSVARVWATAAGASHQAAGVGNVVNQRMTGEFLRQLRRLSDEYLARLALDHARLAADPRVADLVARANRAIEESHALAPAPPKKKGGRKRDGDDGRDRGGN